MRRTRGETRVEGRSINSPHTTARRLPQARTWLGHGLCMSRACLVQGGSSLPLESGHFWPFCPLPPTPTSSISYSSGFPVCQFGADGHSSFLVRQLEGHGAGKAPGITTPGTRTSHAAYHLAGNRANPSPQRKCHPDTCRGQLRSWSAGVWSETGRLVSTIP
jgi:hypothetical protein